MAQPSRPVIGNVLIVCVGNICRSPMAEAMLREALAPHGVTVRSAGLAALVDYPADEHACALMQERDIDISAHRARQLTPELLAEADLVLVMEKGHKRAIEQNEPAARGKVYRVAEWQDTDIPDPYRQPRAAFEQSLSLIEPAVDEWVRRICRSGASAANKPASLHKP